jgi:hypothetical protein
MLLNFNYFRKKKMLDVVNDLDASEKIDKESLKGLLNLMKKCEVKVHSHYEGNELNEYHYDPKRLIARNGWDAFSLIQDMTIEDVLEKLGVKFNPDKLCPIPYVSKRKNTIYIINEFLSNNGLRINYVGSIKKSEK